MHADALLLEGSTIPDHNPPPGLLKSPAQTKNLPRPARIKGKIVI